MSLSDILPTPKWTVSQTALNEQASIDISPDDETNSNKLPFPPYLQRNNFVPRSIEDYGDGGAFPECHVVQYPLDMGRKLTVAKIASLEVDSEGNVRHDAIVKQGLRKGVKVFSQLSDMQEKQLNEDELERPDDETIQQTTERTRSALEKLIEGKLKAKQPKCKKDTEDNEPYYVRYTPSQQGSHNSGAKNRIIRMHKTQLDPLEPPKFKSRKVPSGPPSPPAPVLHSPPRKLAKEEQQNWKIPPMISNWKNPKGYTIPLDKRLAADGRGLQDYSISDDHPKLSDALNLAERNARKELEARAKWKKNVMLKQKESKDNELKELAAKARERRSGMAQSTRDTREMGDVINEDEYDAKLERDEIRRDKKRDRKREYALQNTKRGKVARERDVIEQIAVGKQAPVSKDTLFDSRLFNQTQGVDEGFGNDEDYNVYSKPLFLDGYSNIYRPNPALDAETYGSREKREEKSTGKFKADQGFEGTEDNRGNRRGPVEFEKDKSDPFGLENFLAAAKDGKKPK